jgi:hypothetical protein
MALTDAERAEFIVLSEATYDAALWDEEISRYCEKPNVNMKRSKHENVAAFHSKNQARQKNLICRRRDMQLSRQPKR